jgi:hypothetical protein
VTRPFAWAALCGLLAVGCGEEAGDLDPDVVNRLARTQGNAVGFDLSGEYEIHVTVDCGECPPVLFLPQLSMCTALGGVASAGADVVAIGTLVQSDGTLLINALDIGGTGPLDSDGLFAVGRVADLTTAISEGHVVLRVDGGFDLEAERPTFEATMRQRIEGKVGDLEADCLQTFDLVGFPR